MNKPITYYKNIAEIATANRKNISKQISIISLIRLIIFIATIIGIWLSWNISSLAVGILIAGIVLLLFFLNLHERLFIKRELEEAKEFIEIDYIDCIKLKPDKMPCGLKYKESLHSYSYVLDILV